MRNLLLLAKLLGNIEPELLGGIVAAVPEIVNQGAAAQPDPPGLLSLAQKFGSKESRRGLAAAASMLESIGRSLGQQRNPAIERSGNNNLRRGLARDYER